MKRLWFAFRCRVLNSHRWDKMRTHGETYFECRDCKRKDYGNEPNLWQHMPLG